MANLFKMFLPKRMVGIDVGTSAIKVVEISRWGQGKKLENYGELSSDAISKEPLLSSQKGSRLLSAEIIAEGIRAILKEAKIKTKAAIFSLPDFSTFSTSFEMPQMPEKEIPEAVRFNASQYIILPINEVTLDWQIISSPAKDKGGLVKVFVVAVPNQVVDEYQNMAKLAGLEVYALESEAMGLVRSLIKGSKKTVCIMDIGVQSCTINLVDSGFLKRSYSFNFYSGQLARAISSALSVGLQDAENIKNTEGIVSSRKGVSETLYPLIDPLLAELKSISSEFLQSEQKQVEEFWLAGGTANLPGLREYFAEILKKPVYVPNCFSDLLYPPIMEEALKEMSPSFSVATGVAMGGFKQK